jgi:hypothetical protein
MNKNAFWAFFVIALVIGFALGTMFSGNINITGRAIPAFNEFFGETDDRIDYVTAGSCTDGTGTFQDFCANAGTVMEYVFNEYNQKCSAHAFSCVLGGFRRCEAGACIGGAIITQKQIQDPPLEQIHIEEEPLEQIHVEDPPLEGGQGGTAAAAAAAAAVLPGTTTVIFTPETSLFTFCQAVVNSVSGSVIIVSIPVS